MRVVPTAGTLALRGRAHWQRCALEHVVAAGEVLMLATEPPPAADPVAGAAGDFDGGFAGLAFDRRCRLFHPLPDSGRIEQVLWGRTGATGTHDDTPAPWPVTAAGTEVEGMPTGALPQRPQALARLEPGADFTAGDATADDLLAVADPAAGCVWLLDLWQQEVARVLPLPAAPLDLSADGPRVWALLEDGAVWQLETCAAARASTWPLRPGAQRLAVARVPGRALQGFVLVAPGSAGARLQALHGALDLAVPHATDLLIESIEADGRCVLVLAQRPGEHLLRLQVQGSASDWLPPLAAPHHDGRGIELAPDGRVAYWTVHGRLRHAVPARGRYHPQGRVFAFGLDAGQPQTRWGRVRVQACLPAGTAITLRAFSADEFEPDTAVVPPAADIAAGTAPAIAPDTQCPALPRALWTRRGPASQALFRDPSPRPLAPPPDEGFAIYDAPVPAAPGRWLWLVVEFSGTRHKSPRLKDIEIEFPGHDLLALLPRTLWREPAAQHFLHRLLMPPAALLDEWAQAADQRHRLLDARIAPESALAWLAGFVGLVLEPCWPAAAQRRLIAAAARLFRTRGTLASLHEMLQLLTDAEVLVVEHFRLRGGGVIGNPTAPASRAVLGGGYRVGGMIGPAESTPVADSAGEDFDGFAHRFTVVVVARLDATQLEGVRRLIEHHKPAHTELTLCTADSGLRAGLGAHVGLTALIGRSGRFEPALLGDAALGAGVVLGRPEIGPGRGPGSPCAETETAP
jgi:phage tail-like protein